MQTESKAVVIKFRHLAFTGCLMALTAWPLEGFAAGPPAGIPSFTPPPIATPSTLPPPASATSANVAVPGAPPMVTSAAPPADNPIIPPPAADGKSDKNFDSLKTKVPDSVKEVVNRLDNTNVITLDDLNSARQAIARIDALIDIEKHISELEKIRQERDEAGGKSAKALAATIPATAIAPPPIFPTPPTQFNREPITPPVSFGSTQPDVTRISGSDGRYSASLKTSDGQSKTYLVGDRLPTGGTIEKITASEVVVNQDGAKKVLHVKNVDMVFSDTP